MAEAVSPEYDDPSAQVSEVEDSAEFPETYDKTVNNHSLSGVSNESVGVNEGTLRRDDKSSPRDEIKSKGEELPDEQHIDSTKNDPKIITVNKDSVCIEADAVGELKTTSQQCSVTPASIDKENNAPEESVVEDTSSDNASTKGVAYNNKNACEDKDTVVIHLPCNSEVQHISANLNESSNSDDALDIRQTSNDCFTDDNIAELAESEVSASTPNTRSLIENSKGQSLLYKNGDKCEGQIDRAPILSISSGNNDIQSESEPEGATFNCNITEFETTDSVNVPKLVKPKSCSVILERLNTTVISALKSTDKNPNNISVSNVEKSNMTEEAPIEKETDVTDTLSNDKITTDEDSCNGETVWEYVLKENKVAKQLKSPNVSRKRKRGRRRTVSASTCGSQAGSESDRTLCNAENSSEAHSDDMSIHDTEYLQEEPELKRMNIELDHRKALADDAMKCDEPNLVASFNEQEDLDTKSSSEDTFSRDVVLSQESCTDVPNSEIEDPLTLGNCNTSISCLSENNLKDEHTSDNFKVLTPSSSDDKMHTESSHDDLILTSAICNTKEVLAENSKTNPDLQPEGLSNEKTVEGDKNLEHPHQNLTNEEIGLEKEKDESSNSKLDNNSDSSVFGATNNTVVPNNDKEIRKGHSLSRETSEETISLTPDIEANVSPTSQSPSEMPTHHDSTSVTTAQPQRPNEGRKNSSKGINMPEQKTSRPRRQAARKAETQIKVLAEQDSRFNEELEPEVQEEPPQECFHCHRLCACERQVLVNEIPQSVCSEECVKALQAVGDEKVSKEKESGTESSYCQRKCHQCEKVIPGEKENLVWETMNFCHMNCLAKFQRELGGFCHFCKHNVPSRSLGKYCVRFGFDIRQFCRSSCLEEFKKGLKVCSYCQKDISRGTEGFLAPVGERGQFKDFCSQDCMEKYDYVRGYKKPPPVIQECAVCNKENLVTVEVVINDDCHKLCSEPCFAAFKFVNRIIADKCNVCSKYFDLSNMQSFQVYYDDVPRRFCCKTCMNVFILANRVIVQCHWCKVKKYNFDMIKCVPYLGDSKIVCSLDCLSMCQFSVGNAPSKREMCDSCLKFTVMQYHLAMSDSSVRSFCGYTCVLKFQDKYKNVSADNCDKNIPVPTGTPKSIASLKTSKADTMPVISSVTSLAPTNQNVCAAGSNLEASRASDGGPCDTNGKTARPETSLLAATLLHTAPNLQKDTEVSNISGISSGLLAKGVSAVETNMVEGGQTTPTHTEGLVTTERNEIENGTAKIGALSSPNTQGPTRGREEFAEITSPVVDAVLPHDADASDIQVSTQTTPISVLPEKFLAKPSMFNAEAAAISLAAGLSPDSNSKGTAGESTVKQWRVMKDEHSRSATHGGSEKSPVSTGDIIEKIVVKEIVCFQPQEPPEMKNVCTLTKPILHSKGVSCRPHLQAKHTQTDMSVTKLPFVPIPVPVPIYVPCPMHMFTSLFPVPVPFPLPIPVPAFIPSTKNVLNNVQNKLPENREETDLMMNTEKYGTDKGEDLAGLSDIHGNEAFENLTNSEENAMDDKCKMRSIKRTRASDILENQPKHPRISPSPPLEHEDTISHLSTQSETQDSPDSHLQLKFSLCLRAWHHWVISKNKELAYSPKSNCIPRFIKPDIRELTTEELNYALCLFISEAKRPNGNEYPPDALLYFCLGIQYYLSLCGRVDNIFTDPYYLKFTDCLDNILQKILGKHVESAGIATRVMEEHLWESKQLGAYSPDVLLNTLIFFNTKYFNLVSVSDHMQLAFSHIVEHWKKPGQENDAATAVQLEYCPPSSITETEGRRERGKRKKYEQHRNEENPFRCPVTLYQFYLSKCPESVKDRNDMFYLQPESSCVPDAPVWFTVIPLGKDSVKKILNRLKVVKEINEAIYSS